MTYFSHTCLSEWKAKSESFYYPMTRLWPLGEVKRRLHFYNVFHDNHNNIFANYESAGGGYHPDSDSTDDEGGEAGVFSTTEGESSDDDVFVTTPIVTGPEK